MDAIKFIVKDVERGQNTKPWLKWLFLLGIGVIPVGLGLGLRNEFSDTFQSVVFLPNVLAALFLIIPPLLFVFKKISTVRVKAFVLFSLLLSLTLSSRRVFFPLGEVVTYSDFDRFFVDAKMCFTRGSLVVSLIGIWILLFTFAISSWPTRPWRVFLSLVCGISGAVMLGFHCDSTSPSHIFFGHIFPGVIFGTLIYCVQELLFRMKLKKEFPHLDSSF